MLFVTVVYLKCTVLQQTYKHCTNACSTACPKHDNSCLNCFGKCFLSRKNHCVPLENGLPITSNSVESFEDNKIKKPKKGHNRREIYYRESFEGYSKKGNKKKKRKQNLTKRNTGKKPTTHYPIFYEKLKHRKPYKVNYLPPEYYSQMDDYSWYKDMEDSGKARSDSSENRASLYEYMDELQDDYIHSKVKKGFARNKITTEKNNNCTNTMKKNKNKN